MKSNDLIEGIEKDDESEDDEVCEKCGGSGTYTVDFHDPRDHHGYGEREEICECQIGRDDGDDMDDDS